MTSGQSGVICCWAFSIDPEEASRVTKVNDITNSPEKIESYDKICLSEYCWGNVSLVFTIDDTLPDKTLRLIYDSDPGWDDDTNVFVPYAPEQWSHITGIAIWLEFVSHFS